MRNTGIPRVAALFAALSLATAAGAPADTRHEDGGHRRMRRRERLPGRLEHPRADFSLAGRDIPVAIA
jgi:hypothetical protein